MLLTPLAPGPRVTSLSSWPDSVGLEIPVGRAPQGGPSVGWSLLPPPLSLCNILGSPWGHEIIIGCGNKPLRETTGTSLVPEDLDGHGISVGFGTQKVRPGRPLRPGSYVILITDRGSGGLWPPGINRHHPSGRRIPSGECKNKSSGDKASLSPWLDAWKEHHGSEPLVGSSRETPD